MFLGEFVHILDSKGRLTIPAKFRADFDAGLVITRGIDRCLAVFPMCEWEKLADQVNDLPLMDRRARALKRLLYANASDVFPDKQGRVLIPPRLREYANLDGEVVIAGVGATVEIWNTDAWDEEREHLDGVDFDIDGYGALGI